jgi:hypothetical protein
MGRKESKDCSLTQGTNGASLPKERVESDCFLGTNGASLSKERVESDCFLPLKADSKRQDPIPSFTADDVITLYNSNFKPFG